MPPVRGHHVAIRLAGSANHTTTRVVKPNTIHGVAHDVARPDYAIRCIVDPYAGRGPAADAKSDHLVAPTLKFESHAQVIAAVQAHAGDTGISRLRPAVHLHLPQDRRKLACWLNRVRSRQVECNHIHARIGIGGVDRPTQGCTRRMVTRVCNRIRRRKTCCGKKQNSGNEPQSLHNLPFPLFHLTPHGVFRKSPDSPDAVPPHNPISGGSGLISGERSKKTCAAVTASSMVEAL